MWNVLRGTVYLFFAGLVLFFAVTRTDVGRDAIRQQLEQRFDDQFGGSIEIDHLDGSLLYDVEATGIRLLDPRGKTVATVDSLRAEPRWSSLATATVSLRSVTLVRPHVHLERDVDGTWTLGQALQGRQIGQGNGVVRTPVDVRVRNGHVTTSRDGSTPESVRRGWLFDYTRSEADSVSFDVSITGDPERRELLVHSGSFTLPEQGLSLRSASGTVTTSRGEWTVGNADIRLANTHIRGGGSFEPARSEAGEPSFDVQLSESRIDNGELRRISPRFPLRETLTVQGRVGGRPDRVILNELSVAHNQSALSIEGTAEGYPDSVNVDVDVPQSTLRPADVAAVWPKGHSEIARAIGSITFSGHAAGTLQWWDTRKTTLDLEGGVEVVSEEGSVGGTWSIKRGEASRIEYQTSFETEDLNLEPLTGRPSLESELNGRVDLSGQGSTWETVSGSGTVHLDSSRVGSVPLIQAEGKLGIDHQGAEGQFEVQHSNGGTVTGRATMDASSTSPTVGVEASLQDLDVSRWIPGVGSTALSGAVTAEAQGTTLQTATGRVDVALDSSSLGRKDSTVSLPPQETSVRLNPASSNDARLEVQGTIASVAIDGPVVSSAFWSAGCQWWTSLRRTATEALDKPLARSSPREDRTEVEFGTEAGNPFVSRTRTAFSSENRSSPVKLDGSISIHRMDLLQRWWSSAPDQASSLRSSIELTMGPDSVQMAGTLSAESLRRGGASVTGLQGTYELDATGADPSSKTVRLSASARADTAQVQNRPVARPSLSFELKDQTGRFELQTGSSEAVRSLRFGTDIELSTDWNRLDVNELTIATESSIWALSAPGTVFAYADALRFDELGLQSTHPRSEALQTIHVQGLFSSRRGDTLSVNMQDVSLFPFSQLAGLSKPLGGQLHGRLAFTGGWSQPQVESNLTVNRLSYDRRVIGRLAVQSDMASDRPDVRLHANLTRVPSSVDSLRGSPEVPGGPRTVEPSRLQMTGRLRLPGSPPTRGARDPIDMQVDVERADLFFFEYIFDETVGQTNGYTTGSVNVGGTFSDPVFDASLELRKGQFTLPEFGLSYNISGSVDVDDRGIHPRSVTLSDEEGSATVDGSILFNEYQYFSFDLSASLEELLIIDVPTAENSPFYGTIRTSGPVSLSGPLTDAALRAPNAQTTPDSELFIPASRANVSSESGFIVFADSTGRISTPDSLDRRDNILEERPEGTPSFVDGLDLNINVVAPEGTTVHLVFDPLARDVVTAQASGRVQLQRQSGDFSVFGSLLLDDGTYQFTAGEVFSRNFSIQGGTITWDGDPRNAQLDIQAQYRTRASPAGLPGFDGEQGRIPVQVLLDIRGRTESPQIELGLALAQTDRGSLVGSQALESLLNQQGQSTEYATSVLLTDTFLLAGDSFADGGSEESGSVNDGLSAAGGQLAFNSLSQLVASQLNQYVGSAIPNTDLNLGVQGEGPNDLDLIYGVNLRLLDERLLIRGEGVYTGDQSQEESGQGPRGEFLVEVQLTPRVSAEAFYRRAGDELTRGQTFTRSAGAGLTYETEFSTWQSLFDTVFGWLVPESDPPPDDEEDGPDPVAQNPIEDSKGGSSDESENDSSVP